MQFGVERNVVNLPVHKSYSFAGRGAFAAVLMSFLASVSAVESSRGDDEFVRVRQVRSGSGVRLFVENRALWDVTVTLKVLARNGRISRLKPETATYPARSETEAARVAADDPSKRCKWRCRFEWMVGRMRGPSRNGAPPDDKVLYRLPFAAGRSYRVAQGYNGKRTHEGRDRYAVDFAMRKGTSVCVARAGVVVDLEESSKTGGSDKKFRRRSNYVCIAHDDGTVAEYHHLHYDGVLVEVGQRVEAGQRIAISGNTGYSTGPHLHFGVYSAVSGRRSQSHPVTFTTAEGIVREPVKGQTYTAK
ncbi:MAG: M23 family metallopeptidase [Phycisphaerales bacterium]|nr:MAG: M23 family metallopeptidase [Phycisphaerales bacterium]